jgi:dCMP deaminase
MTTTPAYIQKPDNEEREDVIRAMWESNNITVTSLPWYTYFLFQAFVVSTRSNDPRTQHGCIIIKPDKSVLSTGYNGFIRQIDDSVLPNVGNEKYQFFIHAEHNAILSCAKHGKSCEGCTAFVTGPPCLMCLQYMYQAGITEVYCCRNFNVSKMTTQEEILKSNIILKLIHPKMLVHYIDLTAGQIDTIYQIKGLLRPSESV